MRRSSLSLGLGLVLALGGCAAPEDAVYVDIARTLRESEATPPDKPRSPTPPAPQPGYSAAIPGKPETVIRDRPRASGAAVRKAIVDAQEKALRDIQNRLRRFYDIELARFELDQQKLVTQAELEAYEKANERVRAEFEAYAAKRGPLLSELTLLAGFPDPNPNSRPPDGEVPPIMAKRFQRTVELRKQIQELDLEFDHAVQQILGGVRDIAAGALAAMRMRVEQFKTELDKKAAEEAAAQVRESASELGLELIEPMNLRLPGMPATSVSIPGEKPLQPAPEVLSQGILRGNADRERLLRHEIAIWAELNRYRIVADPNEGKDRTSEFLEWRGKFEVGR